MRPKRLRLRGRLALGAVAAAAVALAALIAAFNLVLDARLRANADNVLHERAAAVLRGLGTVDGRLSVLEAPDLGTVDEQTWIFAGAKPLEQPARVDARDQTAALALAHNGSGFLTVQPTDTRLLATPVRAGPRRLGTVVVGASLNAYESSASSALLGSIILGAIMLAATAALSLWLIGRALRPVSEMTAKAADWGEHDVSRRFFAGEPRDEISGLAAVFDRLLSRLSDSLRREQQLTAEISHELRTPLTKIVAAAELAGARPRDAHRYEETLAMIRRQADDLERVLDTLLASARAGGADGSRAGDARAAALAAADGVRDSLAREGKSIDVACDERVRTAVPEEVVERILSPLLENAARFAAERVVIEVQRTGPFVVFEVRDDGPGVSAAERERIFAPGYRTERTSRNGHAGAGLGLALVRRLVHAAGGDVEARASLDGGCFTVRLPVP